MRLNRRTDYALRALLYLATEAPAGGTSTEIAQRFGLSSGHMLKVMQALAGQGLVVLGRGRGVPSRLARPAHDITVGEVVRALEPSELVECFGPKAESRCPLTGACGLANTLANAQAAFYASLDGVTLGALTKADSPLLIQLRVAGER